MDDNFSLPNELIKGLISIVSVAIGGWIALANYRSNQWWEAKRKIYDELLELLEACATSSDKMWKNLDQIDSDNMFPSHSAPDHKGEILKRYVDASTELKSLVEKSNYLTSFEVKKMLQQLVRNIPEYFNQDSTVNAFCLASLEYTETLEKFVYAARRDLKVTSFQERTQHGWKSLKISLSSVYSYFTYGVRWFWLGEEKANKTRKSKHQNADVGF